MPSLFRRRWSITTSERRGRLRHGIRPSLYHPTIPHPRVHKYTQCCSLLWYILSWRHRRPFNIASHPIKHHPIPLNLCSSFLSCPVRHRNRGNHIQNIYIPTNTIFFVIIRPFVCLTSSPVLISSDSYSIVLYCSERAWGDVYVVVHTSADIGTFKGICK